MCECCGGDCKLTNDIYSNHTNEPYIDFIRKWRRRSIMSGECERCGEDALHCTCKSKHRIELHRIKLTIAKKAYKEITAAITELEKHYLCRIQWDEYINVDGEGFGFFELTSKE